MPNEPRSQSQSSSVAQAKAKSRTSERPAEQSATRDRVNAIGLPLDQKRADATRSHGLDLEEAIVTAGRAGARNITIEKFWVEVEGHWPAAFNVASLDSHGLEVVMEQLSYRKAQVGTGALKTGLTPIAPIGTKGRILVKDVATGETLEQPWTWHLIRGGFFSGLWKAIKKMLWKG